MPATGHSLLVLLAAAGALWGDDPPDAIRQAATALGSGDAAAFVAAFDPSTPGLPQIRSDAAELIRQADAQSNIEFGADTGDSRAHSLELNWTLRMNSKDTTQGRILRQAQVLCRVTQHGGPWRIAAFEPRDFFRPPHVAGAWNVLESAAAALSLGSAGEFLSYFDPSMPGYARLAAGAATLVTRGEVQSSIELAENDGSDTSRAIEVDWTLSIVYEDTMIHRGAREQRVKCRVELQGKRWRITAVEPVEFFSAISTSPP